MWFRKPSEILDEVLADAAKPMTTRVTFLGGNAVLPEGVPVPLYGETCTLVVTFTCTAYGIEDTYDGKPRQTCRLEIKGARVLTPSEEFDQAVTD